MSDITFDFYDLHSTLSEAQRAKLLEVRHFFEAKVRPIVNHHWVREEFPHHLIPELAQLNLAGSPFQGYGCPGNSWVFDGILTQEVARVDCSMATFIGVHTGLAMGTLFLCGSEEQKQRWLPPMSRMECIGAFGLTEPEHGSDVAKGLLTTAQKDGSDWILNGNKKWIGNATFADVTIIWARDVEDSKVKGFLVEKGTPGFKTTKMENKIALRIVQNAEIELADCRIPSTHKLERANSFTDTARVLRMTRAGVAWQAVGCMAGAYELALAYSLQRKQFGKPIGGFQLVQDRLATMLANLTSAQTLAHRLSQLQDADQLREEHASLAKMFCTVKMRESVGLARELLGGNGILLEHNVGRFVADAEAIYSYEGTREVNALIVGRAVTGLGAFV